MDLDIVNSHHFSIIAITFVFALALLFSQEAIAYKSMDMSQVNHVKGVVGAIVDCSSRTGKEEKVAMEMAIHDFFNHTNQRLILLVKNSQREPIQAALAAQHLINSDRVQAILGPRTWEEASLVAELGSQSHVPVLSLADSTPPWATNRWPFLIQATPSNNAQMKAVAAIVQSWGWRRTILIYEDNIHFVANGVIPHLSDSLREVGAEISNFLALSPLESSSTASSLSEELEKLKRHQCRVFVVHSSLPLALRLFEMAKKMKMMGKDYVWITTDSVTNLFYSTKAAAISSIQGIVGLKSYFPETGPQFQDFYLRFGRRFSMEHPEEENHEPGIFALQAYDAAWAVALAMEEGNIDGQHLLNKILSSEFNGLSGKFQFTEGKLAPTQIFQIINVILNSYKELGFWTEELGFSATIDGRTVYNASMENLGQVLWAGGARSTPRGWALPTINNPLRIGVPSGSLTNRFVKVEYDQSANNYSFTGYSINIFRTAVEHLPYHLPYEFIPFEGTYDNLVKQVYLKNFDAAVGDIAIIRSRYKHADFTHPHTESGLVMIVPIQSQLRNKAWLFMKPFTKAMWVLTVFITVYNGFVIWMIERNHYSELKGSALNQFGTLLWLAFVTLFSLRGEKLHSNLSRMATVVWLFVALVIMQSYTASLTSMLTTQRLEPAVRDIETLKSKNAMIGFSRKSFVVNYLVGVLNFNLNNIKNFSTMEEYEKVLRTGEISAAFLEVPVAKLFLTKYCRSFITAGPTYNVGGYGFAFPKRSPMLADINEALLNITEKGILRELQNSLSGSEKCVDVETDTENVSLSPNSFWALFIFTTAISTAALVIYIVREKWRIENFFLQQLTNIWLLTIIHWGHQNRHFSNRGRITDARSPKYPPNIHIGLVEMA